MTGDSNSDAQIVGGERLKPEIFSKLYHGAVYLVDLTDQF
jgi:hypothetical protein